MPNPNPVQVEKFKSQRQQPIGKMPSEPLGKRTIAVKVGESIEAYLFSLSPAERITLVRSAITDAVLEKTKVLRKL